ncbi:hypothetical protein EIP91_010149 [Steccherinum ochraceum]|uniref:RNA-dependent RNA polymerase n=1 Tax=Steccherinum ochraceum TaxID=92696 RepID=A0A4R0RV21_9APHY|nr:hypothetical protein EIP91_010149 [Steccherinum ochraceum]
MASGEDELYSLKRVGSESSLHSQASSTDHYTDPQVDQFIQDFDGEDETGIRVSEEEEFAVPIQDLDFAPTPPVSTPSSNSSTSLGKRKSCEAEDFNDRRPPKPELHSSLHVLSFEKARCSSRILNTGAIRFGVQWELARLKGRDGIHFNYSHLRTLATSGTYSKQAQDLYDLLDEDGDHRIIQQLYEDEFEARSPWSELDAEQRAFAAAPESGLLGCNEDDPPLKENPSWHGGKVHFACKLVCPKGPNGKPNGSPTLIMEKPYLGPSSRMTRRFGSDRFIRIKISSDLFYSDTFAALEFFLQPFFFNARVYRSFFAKDTTVFLVNTDESFSVNPDGSFTVYSSPSTSDAPSLVAFLDSHNPLAINRHQPMSKWTSRTALGLSNSVPGARIAPADYLSEPDIENVKSDSPSAKTPSELIMTDGCGFASQSLLTTLYHKFRWESYPTAIQVRVNGAKGLLLAHPTDAGRTHRVWVRPSQTKIHYPSDARPHPALYTLDILRSSHMSSPARLATEVIINLAENGVPVPLLAGMMQVSIQERLDRLMNWRDTSQSLKVLWDNVSREGNVFSARLGRIHTAAARALGLRYEDPDEEVDDDVDVVDGVVEQSSAWWGDPISGQPSSLEETVMLLLDSGFSPAHCPVLALKLVEVQRKALKSCTQKVKLEVPHSCTAFIVPDPCGVLEPGEVQIKSSSMNLLDQNDNPTDIVIGDVLLTRHPCKVASDVQKAKAVLRPELHKYADVIVISTKGHLANGISLSRHLASMTGGGDYDGDLMFAYWTPELVQHFKEADPSLAIKPPDLDTYLVKPKETVEEFLSRAPADPHLYITELQKHLLSGLRNTEIVGRLSGMWETSMYMNGYNHPDTVQLAYLFCEALDGSKTGVTIDRQHYSKLQRKYGTAPPWKPTSTSSNSTSVPMDKPPDLIRPPHLGLFVMDELSVLIKAETTKFSIQIDKQDFATSGARCQLDADLAAPFKEAEERARKLKEQDGTGRWILALEAIKSHVVKMREIWSVERQKLMNKTRTNHFTDASIEQRQDVLRKISRQFDKGPEAWDRVAYSETEMKKLKASYAYIYNHELKPFASSARFPFDVAFRELCIIKANAVSKGRVKPVVPDFYEHMALHRKAVKMFKEWEAWKPVLH